MKKNVFTSICYIVFLGIIIISSPNKLYGEELSCSSFDAVYKPHQKYKLGNMDYKITLDQEKDIYPGSVLAYFKIHMYKNNVLQSILTLPYLCSLGSTSSCYSYVIVSDNENKIFDTIALKKDFSATDAISLNDAAYAIIFPSAPSKFRYLDWKDKKEYITYYTKEKIHPTAGMPEVWILNNCSK